MCKVTKEHCDFIIGAVDAVVRATGLQHAAIAIECEKIVKEHLVPCVEQVPVQVDK